MNLFKHTAALLTLSLAAGTAVAGALPHRNAQGLLADGSGHTLYTYDRDGTSGASRCVGTCEAVWPPYLLDKTSKPVGDYRATLRADGRQQWVYRGRPLYLFVGDEKPGDHDGDGVNGSWHVLH